MSPQPNVQFEDFWRIEIKRRERELEEAQLEHGKTHAEFRQIHTQFDQMEKELTRKQNECDQKNLDLMQKQIEVGQKQIEVEKKQIQLNYARNQLLLEGKQRLSREALESLDKSSNLLKGKLIEANRVSAANATTSGGHSASISAEQYKPTDACISREGRPFKPVANYVLNGRNIFAPGPSRLYENDDQKNAQNGSQLLSAFMKSEPSLIVKLKYQTEGKQMIDGPSPMLPKSVQDVESTSSSKKRPREEGPSNIKPNGRAAQTRRMELRDEVSELESTSIEKPTAAKRRRPSPGSYRATDVLDPNERAQLMARFCNPIIKIFKTALRGVAPIKSDLRTAFDTLQARLTADDMKPGEEFWEWMDETKKTIAVSEVCYGANKATLVSRLQRWCDECDDCMFSCMYDLEHESERVLAVDRAVETLQGEYASLAEDIVPIVESDII